MGISYTEVIAPTEVEQFATFCNTTLIHHIHSLWYMYLYKCSITNNYYCAITGTLCGCIRDALLGLTGQGGIHWRHVTDENRELLRHKERDDNLLHLQRRNKNLESQSTGLAKILQGKLKYD